MVTSIHGPGPALEFHLDLWRKVDATVADMRRREGQRVRSSTLPSTFLQRARLMTSVGLGEGQSVAARKDTDSSGSKPTSPVTPTVNSSSVTMWSRRQGRGS